MKTKMNITIFHKFTERLLIFLTVNSFFSCLLFMLRDICISNNVDTINLTTILVVFVSAIIIYSIFIIFFNEKSSTANFFRLLFFYALISGGIFFLLRHFIYFSGIVAFICMIAQAILYKKILEAFFSHDTFEIHCEAKNNSQLQKELYDYNIYLSDAAAGYKQNRSILLILMCVLIIGAGVCIGSNFTLSFFSIFLLFVFFICVASNFFLYSHYVREATFASNGFVNVFDYRLRIFFTSILICAVCFLLGLALSSNHSLIKLSWFFNLFNKKSNYTGGAAPAPLPELDPYEQRLNEIRAIQQAYADAGNNKSNNILAIICGSFFVIGIAWFFLKPFITKVFGNAIKNADLKSVFKRFFSTIAKVFKKLLHLKIRPAVYSSANAERFKNDMTEFLKTSRKSKEKKAELDRLTTQFMKIIDWGEMNGIHYTKNLAPAEYTQQLSNKNAELAGNLFEKALYAKECLTKEEEAEFEKYVSAAVAVVFTKPQEKENQE